MPTDPEALRALLEAEREAHRQTQLRHEETKALLVSTSFERDLAKAKLQAMIKRYFGRSSEKLDPNQLALAWAAVEADHALQQPPPALKKERKPKDPGLERRARRLEDLPVLETVTLDLSDAERLAPDGTRMVKIREEVTEEVDYQPGKLYRRQIIRIVYASPSHACPPKVAVLPARVIPGGQVGAGLIAHVLLSKYADAIPLYRQAAMLERLGPGFTRQAMGQWVEQGAGLFRPVHQELLRIVRAAPYVQGDETPHPVLDPARPGAARDAWLWTFLAPAAEVVVFDFQMTRSHEPALAFLDGYQGVFQTDGYSGYDKALGKLSKNQQKGIVHVNCMAHSRRIFVAALESGDDRAAPFLAYLGALYQIEAEIRDSTPEERERVRGARSHTWLIPMELALKKASEDLTVLPKSILSKAVHYALRRWPELTRYAEPGYGQVEIDSNKVENCIRPSAVAKKNFLFVGHPDAGWRSAVLYSVLGTCKLQGINPWNYLSWALPKLAGATNHSAR